VDDALGPPVPRHGLLEGVDHHVCPLRIVDPVADHEARVVVDQDEGERRAAVDMTMHEVEVPQVVGAHRFVALVVRLALDLGWPIARVLHHAPGRIHAHFDTDPAELIDDLTRPEAGMPVPLGEDFPVSLRLDVRRRGTACRRWRLTGGRLLDLSMPAVDREAADAELRRRRSDAVL